MDNAVRTVSELTRSLKNLVEGSYPFVWVRGQVTNLSRPSSGHVYFSLKDEDATLAAVWFAGSQKKTENFDPLTGEVYEDGPRPSLAARLENGMEIICAGRLSVYAPRGVYQIVVELAQEGGQGRLQAEFEQLKLRLMEKGYFAQERKRPLPRHPARVAVITAPTGAAIHDFLRMAHERGWGSEIRIYPVPVQGEDAPPVIARALDAVSREGWAEVTVLIRGGGSLEDLWAFNTEVVAVSVFRSQVPVLAGIGHEVDVSITDLVADLRAATPTHAAQLLWMERRELVQRVDEAQLSLTRAWDTLLLAREARLVALTRALGWLSPLRLLERWDEKRDALEEALRDAMDEFLAEREEECARMTGRAAVLMEETLRRAELSLERLTARLEASSPSGRLDRLDDRLEALTPRLSSAMTRLLEKREEELEKGVLRLEALNPVRPLERGYLLARKKSGEFLRSVTDAAPGDVLDILLKDGEVTTRVEKVRENGRNE
ncbi:exodeoxyribonuclease VII large subunit [Desulfovibrio sp. OttesenSCG-928-I05]|nr:exodeoxyribonuclease VII large subunit [Desulfovibrio sp. OttesenSCG-928-I05]